MKIDTGNFGQAQRQVVDTRIDRGNPAEMAEAKISSARNTAQLQGMANQAWDRLGGQMQQVGAEMHQQIRQLAQQKSALVIQQKQLHAQGVLQTAQDKVDAGELKAADVKSYVSDAMSKFKYEDIDGLGEGGRLQLEKGLQGVDMSVNQNTDHLFRAAHKVETRVATDEMIANNERLALTSGADLDKAASLYDSPVFQAQAREAYGAEFGKVITQAKAGIYAAGAKKLVLDNRDSYGGLQAVEKEFKEGGKFYQKLDADTELSITSQIESRKGIIEAKAVAAEQKRQNEIQRQQHAQEVADNKAVAAINSTKEFISKGGVPDAAYIEKLQKQVQNTNYANVIPQVQQNVAQVQDFRKMSLAKQDEWLSAHSASMHGNPESLEIFNNLQASHEAQKRELIKDPIVAVTSAAGAAIPPLPMDQIRTAKDPEAVKQANQNFSEVVYQRKHINDIARKQTPDAPKTLLTEQERSDYKAEADALPPQERANFYKTLANAGGRYGVDLVKEVSGSDTIAAAAYHTAANPKSTAGALIAQGDELINDKKSNYKAPPVSKTQSEIDSTLADVLPPKQRSTIGDAVNAHYVASRVAKGKDPAVMESDEYQDSITEVVGSVIQYGNGKIVVPAGTDPNKFREHLYSGVMQLPNGKDAMALIETGQARVQAVGAKTYMLTTPSGAPRFDPQTGKPVYIQVP